MSNDSKFRDPRAGSNIVGQYCVLRSEGVYDNVPGIGWARD